MDEEYFPQHKIELKSQWYAMVILSAVTILIFVPLYFIDPSFREEMTLSMFILIAFCFIILPSTLGLIRRRVFRVFKIDDPNQTLIIEYYWTKLRVYRAVIPLNDIKRFEVILKMVHKAIRGSAIFNYLALAYKSGKNKTLSLARDKDFVIEYARKLNDFLGQNTTMDKNVLQEQLKPYISKEEQNLFLYLCISMVLLIVSISISLCLIVKYP